MRERERERWGQREKGSERGDREEKLKKIYHGRDLLHFLLLGLLNVNLLLRFG